MDDVKIDEILMPGDDEENNARQSRIKNGFWNTVKKAAGRVPFMEEVVASYYCAMDPETPNRTRGILLAALAYFVLPLDMVPDFLVGFGFTDDIAVLTAALATVKSSMEEKHFLAAKIALQNDKTETG